MSDQRNAHHATQFPKACACARVYTYDEWRNLPGDSTPQASSRLDGEVLVFKRCGCGANVTAQVRAPEPGAPVLPIPWCA